MYYLIMRIDQGKGYVTTPGSKHSYTHNIQQAQIYLSKQDAEASCCDNEVAIPLPDLLNIKY